MDEERKEQQIRAFSQAVAQTTLGVVSKDINGRFSRIGTGSLIRWNGEELLLTAAHVIEGCKIQELRFFTPSSTARYSQAPQPTVNVPNELAPLEKLEFTSEYRWEAEEVDVAILGLSPESIVDHWCFREIKADLAEPTPPQQLFMMGYPRALARRYGTGDVAMRKIEYPRISEWGSLSLKNYNPAGHVLLDYPAVGEYDPAGFSGCGLWTQPFPSDRLWFPQPLLAGMIVGYHARTASLIAVRRATIIDCLTQRISQ